MNSGGQKVMLDYDLAEICGVETAQLKRAVRRNEKRFVGLHTCLSRLTPVE